MYNFSVALAMPAYKEEANIRRQTEKCVDFLERNVKDFRVIITDDCGGDKTGEIADLLHQEDPRVMVKHHLQNKGYAQAVITGLNCARDETDMEFVSFTDSDGQLDVCDFDKFFPLLEEKPKQMVIGYRVNRADNKKREFMSRGWSLINSMLLWKWIRDVDCALKIFPVEMIAGVELRSQNATINYELLRVAGIRNIPISQVGVSNYPREAGESTGGDPKVIIRSFMSIFELWLSPPEGRSVPAIASD